MDQNNIDGHSADDSATHEMTCNAQMLLSGLYLVAHPSSEAALDPTDDALIHGMPELVCNALLLMGGMYFVAQHAEAAQQNISRYKVMCSHRLIMNV